MAAPLSPAGRLLHLIRQAATLDAPAALSALKLLDFQPPGPELQAARHILLARFAELDPVTALTFVDTLPPGEQTDGALTVMAAWAARDPASAAAHLAEESGGFGLSTEASIQSAARIAESWTTSDPASAAAWAAELEPEMRRAALSAIARGLAAADPSAAVQFTASLPDSTEREAASRQAALQWAQNDPSAAAAWARSASGTGAAAGVVEAWMLRDPAAASAWVDSLPRGTTRDNAIVALTQSSSMKNDAAGAAAWAATIQSEALRNPVLTAALRTANYQASPGEQNITP